MKTPFRAAGALMLSLSLCGGLMTMAQTAPAKGAKAKTAAKTGRGAGRGGMRLIEQLNLTDAQKAKLKPIMEAARTQMVALRNDDTLSMADKRTKMKAMREANDKKISAILTADQKKKLEDLKAKMKAERGAKGEAGARDASKRGMARGPEAPVPAT